MINQISRKKNKHFLEFTLKEFYETKELYKENQIENTFEHNLSIINELRKDFYKDLWEESGLDDILNMTFSDLIVQYLRSEVCRKNINKLNGNEKYYYSSFATRFIEDYYN